MVLPHVCISYVKLQVCLALWSSTDNLTMCTTPSSLPLPLPDPTLWLWHGPSTGRSVWHLSTKIFKFWVYIKIKKCRALIVKSSIQSIVNMFVCLWRVQVGDEVAISTSSYNAWETEKRKISDVSTDGRVLTLDQPLTHTHIGQFNMSFKSYLKYPWCLMQDAAWAYCVTCGSRKRQPGSNTDTQRQAEMVKKLLMKQ